MPTATTGDDGRRRRVDDGRPGESRNARRRRRRRNKGGGEAGGGGQSDNRFEQRDRQQPRPAEAGADGARRSSTEPVRVAGYLDLRDEGYGFLRVNGYLSEPRRRLHPGEAHPPVRAAQGRLRHRPQPSGRAQREEPGDARDPHRQRRRPRQGQEPAAVRGPHRAVPRRAAEAGEPGRPDQHDGADHRPRLADRQGPARHHRVAARRPARRRS